MCIRLIKYNLKNFQQFILNKTHKIGLNKKKHDFGLGIYKKLYCLDTSDV